MKSVYKKFIGDYGLIQEIVRTIGGCRFIGLSAFCSRLEEALNGSIHKGKIHR